VLNLTSKPPSLVLTLSQFCNDDEQSMAKGDEYWLHSLRKQSRSLGSYNKIKILTQLLVGKME